MNELVRSFLSDAYDFVCIYVYVFMHIYFIILNFDIYILFLTLVILTGVTLEEKAPNFVGTMVDVGLDQVRSMFNDNWR